MQTQRLSINEMLLTGLAIHRGCRETIEQVYQERATDYDARYLTSPLKDEKVKRIFTMASEEKFNQLIGILSYCQERQQVLLLERIIRSVYPPLVNYIKKASRINLSQFYRQHQLEQLSEEDNFTYGACLLYLAAYYRKAVLDDGQVHFIHQKWNRYVEIATVGANGGKLLPDSLAQKKWQRQWIERGETEFTPYQMSELTQKSTTVSTFVSSEIEFKTLRSLGIETYWDMKQLYEVELSDYERARQAQFQDGFNRYIGCYSRYLNRLGLDSHDILEDTPLTKSILDLMFDDFGQSVEYNKVPESEQPLYLASALLLYNMVYLYQQVKANYLNLKAERDWTQLQELAQSLEVEKSVFEAKQQAQAIKFNTQEEELIQLRQRVKTLEVENTQLQTTLEKSTHHTQDLQQQVQMVSMEFNQLKDQLNEAQQRCVATSTVSFEEKVTTLTQYRLGMAGGRVNIRELNQLLPNLVFYDTQNEDLSSMQGLDMVFINTDYMTHALSARILVMSDKVRTPTRYLSGVNRQLLIETMYEQWVTFQTTQSQRSKI